MLGTTATLGATRVTNVGGSELRPVMNLLEIWALL